MSRQLFGLVLSFTLAAECFAAGLPPIIDRSTVDQTPRVRETGKLLFIDAPGTDNRAGTPPGMLAARLAVNDKFLRWTPSPAARVTGGAALAAAALSPDESVLVLAETVGAPEGPNSTRLLYFNLRNGRLINAKTLENRRLVSLGFAGYDRLLAIEEPQPELNRPGRLLLFDPADPADLLESRPVEAPLLSAVSDGTRTWYTIKGSPYFLQLANGAFDAAPQRQRTLAGAEARLQLSSDRKHLYLFGTGRVEFYKLTQRGAELASSVTLPAGAAPEWGAPASADGAWLVIGAANQPAWLAGRNTVRQLAEKCSAIGCLLPDGRFLLGLPVNESLGLYRLPAETKPETTVSPRKLKPLSKNDNFRLFPLTGSGSKALLVDHRGNLWQLEIRPRRWLKNALYSVE